MLSFRFLSYDDVAFSKILTLKLKVVDFRSNFLIYFWKFFIHSKLKDYTSQCQEYKLLFTIIIKYSELAASRKFVAFQGTFAIFCKYLVLIYLNQQYECE